MYKRIILMILVIGFLLCNPASAVNNGDFETGDLTGWSTSTWHASESLVTVSGAYAYSGDYGARIWQYVTPAYPANHRTTTLYQSVDFSDKTDLSFWVYRSLPSAYWDEEVQDYSYFRVYVDSDLIFANKTTKSWEYVEIDISEYDGTHTLKFALYSYAGWQTWSPYVYIDDVVISAPPPAYITWSTWPEDSWAVGNYSMITVGLPRPPDPVDFYIKTPSTDYIKKPLTKSPLVKTWNYEESQWYYQYFHTVYHSQYGDYSCKIVNSSADFIEYSNITVPYSSPDVPIPPVVTIPTPDPIETPPEWNVTIPEQYENVSWIFDYTDFWDELGITLNDTLYSTVGLIFIPMESINESVYTVYTHVDTAADMVSGSEHTNVIVQVAWNVIPDSIKTVFIGAAAIGLCIFILHRRT